MTVAEAARDALARPGAATSIEAIWRRAALETFVAEQVVDPPLEELRRRTAPERAWADVVPWPREHQDERLARLCDTHRLAIVYADRPWLESLSRAWEAAPAGTEGLALRAQGEIGLGLGAGGGRPSGWTADEIESLSADDPTESVLRPGLPSDRAWVALATGDLAGARRALAEVDAEAGARWPVRDMAAFLRGVALPGVTLRVEARALRALCDRR